MLREGRTKNTCVGGKSCICQQLCFVQSCSDSVRNALIYAFPCIDMQAMENCFFRKGKPAQMQWHWKLPTWQGIIIVTTIHTSFYSLCTHLCLKHVGPTEVLACIRFTCIQTVLVKKWSSLYFALRVISKIHIKDRNFIILIVNKVAVFL